MSNEEAREIFQLAMKFLRTRGSIRPIAEEVMLTYGSPLRRMFVQCFLSGFRLRESNDGYVLVPQQFLLYVSVYPHYVYVVYNQSDAECRWADTKCENPAAESVRAVREALTKALVEEALGVE
ncbi:MAG: hypothetical protein DRN29_05115 [Thermoplasmata archaeon]|nr:MAG: hypothetical protein DRN29_05115 [Thermoplasmata archaeon]